MLKAVFLVLPVQPASSESSVSIEKEGMMKNSTKDQSAGKLHETKGKLKEKLGKVTNDPDLGS